jgi:diadenosine tetraphosphate (Ap4A) HIT family hydrolase
MCDPEQCRYIASGTRKVSRVLDEDEYTYVIVPRESHVRHHLLVVLKPITGVHKCGFIDLSSSDITVLGKPIAKWCGALKAMGYDTVYSGCYSDEGHVHFHLIPLRHNEDKGEKGKALQWLACKERQSDARPFSSITEEEKEWRMNEIKAIVCELREAKESVAVKVAREL